MIKIIAIFKMLNALEIGLSFKYSYFLALNNPFI